MASLLTKFLLIVCLKFWTESYAKPTSKEDAISRVCEMGFDRESAKKALEKTNWDESAAVNQLLGM